MSANNTGTPLAGRMANMDTGGGVECSGRSESELGSLLSMPGAVHGVWLYNVQQLPNTLVEDPPFPGIDSFRIRCPLCQSVFAS